jgi:hypothetical protein
MHCYFACEILLLLLLLLKVTAAKKAYGFAVALYRIRLLQLVGVL